MNTPKCNDILPKYPNSHRNISKFDPHPISKSSGFPNNFSPSDLVATLPSCSLMRCSLQQHSIVEPCEKLEWNDGEGGFVDFLRKPFDTGLSLLYEPKIEEHVYQSCL